MKTYITEFENLKKSFEDFTLNEIELSFSKTIDKGSPFGKNPKSEIVGRHYIRKTFNINIIDLFIEACKGEIEADEFEDKVNEYFGLQPHQFLTVNRKVYKRNTIGFHCSPDNCENCLNFILCKENAKGKINLVLEVQATYLRLRRRDVDKDNPFEESLTFGANLKNVFKRRQNDLLEILTSKLIFFALQDDLSSYNFGGRK